MLVKTVLVPAGGLGSRVGRPEAKEMLPRPQGCALSAQPLISYALHLAALNDARAHVILRREKRHLSEYLESVLVPVPSLQYVELTREWPETLILSREHWGDLNVVVLPDSDFKPDSVVGDIFSALEGGAETVFGIFSPDNSDFRPWGAIDDRGDDGVFHCEKPIEWRTGTRAWGVFGFRRQFGMPLLEQMLASTFDHEWRLLPAQASLVELDSYCDLTRG